MTQPPDSDDADSAIGDENFSSTASVSSSILKYRTVLGRTYHSDRGDTQYWYSNSQTALDGRD